MPFVRRLYLPLLLLLCFLYSMHPLEGGDDFWARAAIGRIVLDTGHIPRETVYLWSAHISWVFQEWGTGVIYAVLLRLGGAPLCLFLNFLLAAAPLVLVWFRAKKRTGEVPSLLVALLVIATIFSQVRWHLRPEAFTILFFTILLLFLTSERKPTWAYLAIAGMFAVWPNLHAGVAAGVLVLWASAILGLFRFGRQTPFSTEPGASPEPNSTQPPWALWLLAGACSIIPLLCNPWRFDYLRVFKGTAATSSHISEWRHFWEAPSMDKTVAWGLCALWCVAFGVWFFDHTRFQAIRNGRRLEAFTVLLRDSPYRMPVLAALLLAGALWLQARRQLWLTSATCAFALAQSAPVLRGEMLYGVLKRQTETFLPKPMQLIGGVGALFVLVAACFVAGSQIPRPFHPVSPSAPVAMSQFLVSKAPKGRMFNDYEYSAALEWFMQGKRPIYIDLINAYPSELFDEWFEVAHASSTGLKVLDTKHIDVIALRPIPADNPEDPILNLARHLDKATDWKKIYDGPDGRVWARKKPFLKP